MVPKVIDLAEQRVLELREHVLKQQKKNKGKEPPKTEGGGKDEDKEGG